MNLDRFFVTNFEKKTCRKQRT